MSKDINHKVGATVTFTGFTGDEGDQPDMGEMLDSGSSYEIVEVDEGEGGDEVVYKIGVPNPDYNPDKRKSKNNPEAYAVEVYEDEIAAGEAEAEEEERAESVPFADVEVGDNVTVIDENGEEFTGEVIKKLKTSMDVDDGDDAGAVRFKAKEMQHIAVNEGEADEDEDEPDEEDEEQEEDEQEEEEPPKATKKKSVKKKATKKAAAKTEEKSKSKAKTSKKKSTLELDDKGIVILGDGEEDEDIIALIESAGDNLCGLAEEIAEETANSEYKLGGILYHVYRTKAFVDVDEAYAGKKGFALYTEKELGVNYRKAMYLVKIYAKWNKFDLPPADLAEIGWTKALHMIDVMDNKTNAKKLIALAKHNTVEGLKDTIKEDYMHRDGPPLDPVKRITFKFRLVESAAEATLSYFEQAKEQLGYTNDNEVFEHIISEWATQNLNVPDKKSTRKSTRKK